MASTFKNSVTGRIGTESRRVYIAPGSTTTTGIGLSLANISTAGVEANVFMKVNTSFQAHMVKNAPIPVGGALVVIGGDQKVVLEAADEIRVTSSAADSVSAIVSVLEQT